MRSQNFQSSQWVNERHFALEWNQFKLPFNWDQTKATIENVRLTTETWVLLKLTIMSDKILDQNGKLLPGTSGLTDSDKENSWRQHTVRKQRQSRLQPVISNPQTPRGGQLSTKKPKQGNLEQQQNRSLGKTNFSRAADDFSGSSQFDLT